MASKVTRTGHPVGYREDRTTQRMRSRKVRGQAIEAQMELFATLDAENARDHALIRLRFAEIRELERRIAARNDRKREIHASTERLERLQVAC